MRSRLAAAGAAFALCACARAGAARRDDAIVPPPSEIPYVHVKLPSSVRDYRSYESGLQHTMLQVRFEIAARDVAKLAARLPCRLGAVEAGEPGFARVGTNDRPWYTPESVRKYRGCDYHRELTSASFLVDVADPQWATVFAVIARE